MIYASENPSEISLHAFGGDLVVSDLTIVGFPQVYIFPQGAGHSLSVSRTAISLRPDAWNVEMHTDASPMMLENVLIDAETSACALTTSAVEMAYVTIVNRGSGRGVCIYGTSAIKNSIIYSVNEADIESQEAALVSSSVFGDIAGGLDPASVGNLDGPVVFENTLDPIGRNRPANIVDQIARDSALAVAAIDFDLLGNSRVIGSAPDRGAFELSPYCDLILKAGFDDNGACPPALLPLGHSTHAMPLCSPHRPLAC
jgi:hypothetical protein